MLNRIVRSCPNCDSKASSILISLTYPEFTNTNQGYIFEFIDNLGFDKSDTFNIVQCQRCFFQYSDTLLNKNLLAYLYEKAIDHDYSLRKVFNLNRIVFFQKQWNRLLEIVSETNKSEIRILDYGSGWGRFLEIASAPTVNCFGYEIDRLKVDYTRDKGFTIFTEEDEIDTYSQYDLIYCNQVLEHVPDPLNTVKAFRRWLKPNGILYISVPFNQEGLEEARLLKQKNLPIPKDINPWEHLNYFTPRSLSMILHDLGFLILEEGLGWEIVTLDPKGRAPSKTSLMCRKVENMQNALDKEEAQLREQLKEIERFLHENFASEEILSSFNKLELIKNLFSRFKKILR